MRGKTLEIILLAGGFLLMVACVYVFIKAEDTGSQQVAEQLKDIRSTNERIFKSLESVSKDQQTLTKAITDAMEVITTQSMNIEAYKKPLSVKLSEPLSINVIYRPAKPKPLIPTAPEPSKTPMLDRSGITKKKNNR